MKDDLCKAFCDELAVRTVPAGLAVKTAFRREDGDAIGFYIIGPNTAGLYRIEDDGATVSYIEACGADLDSPTRAAAFRNLLEEYGAIFDEETVELATESLRESELPQAAMRFVALLLRLQDMLLLMPERAASTFKEDALRDIQHRLAGRATIYEGEPIAPSLTEFQADVVIRSADRPPVAVYFGQSEQKVYEAILLQMAATYEARVPCSVVVLLEKGNAVSQKMRQRADNRLAAVPVYRGDESAAVARIEREVFGQTNTVH